MFPKPLVRFFAVQKPSDGGQPPRGFIGAAGQGDVNPTTGVFLTPQSIASFPVATMVIKGIWELAKKLEVPHAGSVWFAFCASLVVGALVILISLEATNPKPKGLQWIILIGLGILNSLFLCAAVLGIPFGASPGGAISGAPSTNAPPSHL